jgi:crotonobetaine/carnitine-CoA ligase
VIDPFERGAGVRSVLERQAARLGPQPLLSLPDARLSYAEADELANRMAQGLAGLGVATGDVVMAHCGNGAPLVSTWFACMKLGAVFLPVNGLLSGEPLRKVMAHAGGAVVVCEASLYPALAAVREDLPRLRHVVVAGGDAPEATQSWEALVDASPATAPPPLADDPGAPAKLMYTSGTTGTPKGVRWSRACEATWGRAYGEDLLPLEAGETVYCCLPLAHATCQGTVLAALHRGGHARVEAGFHPYGFWRRLRQDEAVMFSFVGTILSVLASRPPRPDDADNLVRRVMGSGAPARIWPAFEERFGCRVVDVWGQTETASCWTMPERLPQRPGTMGRPNPRFEAKVVDDHGGEVPPGTDGELWIRPHDRLHMFEGYLGDDGLVVPAWDDDGWYHSGDLARRDPDGEYVFAGRRRDAIRRRGEILAPGEIEEAALAHPDVLEVAAVGVAVDGHIDEEVKLCAVARDGVDLAAGELHEFLSRRLPKFMVPRYIDIRTELPKTPTTRVRKYQLADEGVAGVWDARGQRPEPTRPAVE